MDYGIVSFKISQLYHFKKRINDMKNYEKEFYKIQNNSNAENYRKIITGRSEDVTREGLENSRERAAKAMQLLTHVTT
jgi:GTP cyclohydrolase I